MDQQLFKKEIRVLLWIFILCIVFFSACSQQIFNGNKVKDPDCYTLQFEKMNQEDSHTLTLQKGDALSLDYYISKGHVDLVISHGDDQPIYRGDDIENGLFDVIVPKSGDYRITVKAKNAAGFINIYAHGE